MISEHTNSALNSRSSMQRVNFESDSFGGINRGDDKNRSGTGMYLDKSNMQPLLSDNMFDDDKKELDENFGCWYSFKRCMGWSVSKEKRTI